jgi:DNA replication protein DnaC
MGASNGGYAALYFSFFFKESIAYVINPQTRIADFTKAAVEEFALACLGAKNINDVSSALGNTESDVRRLYSSGFDNFIIYVQNETDHHVQTQMNPFLACLQKDIVVIRGNWGVGHTAPPVSYMSELLKKLIHMSIIDLKNKGSSLLSVGQDMEVGSSEVKHGDEVIG